MRIEDNDGDQVEDLEEKETEKAPADDEDIAAEEIDAIDLNLR